MTESKNHHLEPRTAREFQEALETLLRTSHENDVEIAGGWDFRTADDHPDWGVEILPVERRNDVNRDTGYR